MKEIKINQDLILKMLTGRIQKTQATILMFKGDILKGTLNYAQGIEYVWLKLKNLVTESLTLNKEELVIFIRGNQALLRRFKFKTQFQKGQKEAWKVILKEVIDEKYND